MGDCIDKMGAVVGFISQCDNIWVGDEEGIEFVWVFDGQPNFMHVGEMDVEAVNVAPFVVDVDPQGRVFKKVGRKVFDGGATEDHG
jgi:hypothetical protein